MTIDDAVAVGQRRFGDLEVVVAPDGAALGRLAAYEATRVLRAAISARGEARVIVATGNSQLAFFRALREGHDVDWSRVRVFHMDEYVGIAADHPASFRAFLRRELIGPLRIGHFHPIDPDPSDPGRTIAGYGSLLARHPADLTCMGIGENGHLAFNDPPVADFDDPATLKVVALDERSRMQQVGEGHFPDLAAVPTTAITLTIPALLAPPRALVIVPEARKAAAVARALTGEISTACPASILRRAGHATLYLDVESAALIGDAGGP